MPPPPPPPPAHRKLLDLRPSEPRRPWILREADLVLARRELVESGGDWGRGGEEADEGRWARRGEGGRAVDFGGARPDVDARGHGSVDHAHCFRFPRAGFGIKFFFYFFYFKDNVVFFTLQ